jgi:hypothetical protein
MWVVPSPGSASTPAIAGVLPAHLGLSNSTKRSESYTVYVMSPSGTRSIASGRLAPSAFISIGDGVLFGAGLNPLLIRASGPVFISEDVGPSGSLGVVTMQGIPMAASLSR